MRCSPHLGGRKSAFSFHLQLIYYCLVYQNSRALNSDDYSSLCYTSTNHLTQSPEALGGSTFIHLCAGVRCDVFTPFQQATAALLVCRIRAYPRFEQLHFIEEQTRSTCDASSFTRNALCGLKWGTSFHRYLEQYSPLSKF